MKLHYPKAIYSSYTVINVVPMKFQTKWTPRVQVKSKSILQRRANSKMNWILLKEIRIRYNKQQSNGSKNYQNLRLILIRKIKILHQFIKANQWRESKYYQNKTTMKCRSIHLKYCRNQYLRLCTKILTSRFWRKKSLINLELEIKCNKNRKYRCVDSPCFACLK